MAIYSFSCDPEVHRKFKELCVSKQTSISAELQRFMELENKGIDNAIESLMESVENLTGRIETLEIQSAQKTFDFTSDQSKGFEMGNPENIDNSGGFDE